MAEKRQVFSAGDLCIDVLQEIKERVEFGREHSLKDLEFSIGGNAANFAVIGSKLGFKPKLLSAIGKDFATPFLKKQLAKAKVSHSLISCNERNAFSIILVDRRGERAIQSTKSCLKEITSKRLERKILPGLKQGDIVFFGGFYHLPKIRPGFKALLKNLKKRGALVCFDTCFDTKGIWDINAFLPLIDFLFVNDLELEHIAKGNTMQKRVASLFNKGSRIVAVKQAGKGATLFAKGFKPKHFSALKIKARVVDTTGAGDAFNAGFVFGLTRNWSLDNCMLAGNFVAARKIRQHGLAAPSVNAIERFVAVNGKLTVAVAKNSKEASRLAAQQVIALLKRKPNASFLLPTGGTPEQMYSVLAGECRKGKADFSKASFFNLDEYAGLPSENKNSFAFFLQKNFLGKINAKKKNIRMLDGVAKNLNAECRKHEAAIQRKGIDLCLLGIGRNGHIAFNEPGSCSYGITRVVKLKGNTRKVNGEDFKGGLAPPKALTVGIKTILESDAALLLAFGKRKRKAVSCMLKSKDCLKCPAANLQRHKNVLVVLDKAAASNVKRY